MTARIIVCYGLHRVSFDDVKYKCYTAFSGRYILVHKLVLFNADKRITSFDKFTNRSLFILILSSMASSLSCLTEWRLSVRFLSNYYGDAAS